MIRSRVLTRIRDAFGDARDQSTGLVPIAEIVDHLEDAAPADLAGYEIDHVVPLSAFDLRDERHIAAAFDPRNHRWIRRDPNRRKGATVDYRRRATLLARHGVITAQQRRIVHLVGPPGVGKSYYARMVCEQRDWQHIDVNDLRAGDRRADVQQPLAAALASAACAVVIVESSGIGRSVRGTLAPLGPEVVALVAPREICIRRIRLRPGGYGQWARAETEKLVDICLRRLSRYRQVRTDRSPGIVLLQLQSILDGDG